MKKVFIALFSAALLLSCGGEKKNPAAVSVETPAVDGRESIVEKPVDPLEEVKSEVKACMESLVKDFNTESYETVNEKYLSREFKYLLDKAHREETQEAATMNSFERRLEFMYCDNNIWADIEGLGDVPVDVVAFNVIGKENVIADVKFGTSTPKTYHLVRENGNWLVADILLANSEFGGYSIKDAIGESLSMSDPNQAQPEVHKRNHMKIFVNENDEIIVIAGEERPVIFGVDKLDDLRQLTKEFITANTSAGVANENYPEPKPVDVVAGITVQSNKHVISLNADQGVSHECYTKVIEALYGAYSDLRAEFAVKYFGSKRLTGEEIALCTDIIPEMIIEGGVVLEKKVVPPPPQSKVIVDIIKVVEDDVEVEEQELVPVQDTSEWGDVEETDAFFVEEEVEEEIFDAVEEQPEFPGGNAELMKFLRDNIKYPKISRDNGSQGRTFVKFIVNSDGSIQDVEVIKSTGDIYLDKEAIRLIEAMPKWKPGRQLGKAVRVKFVLPVNFRLQ